MHHHCRICMPSRTVQHRVPIPEVVFLRDDLRGRALAGGGWCRMGGGSLNTGTPLSMTGSLHASVALGNSTDHHTQGVQMQLTEHRQSTWWALGALPSPSSTPSPAWLASLVSSSSCPCSLQRLSIRETRHARLCTDRSPPRRQARQQGPLLWGFVPACSRARG